MLLVTKGFNWPEFFETTGDCVIGVVMLAASLTGYGLARMPNWERLWLGFASVLVISPSRTATLIGLAMGVPVAVRQLAAWRAARARGGGKGEKKGLGKKPPPRQQTKNFFPHPPPRDPRGVAD